MPPRRLLRALVLGLAALLVACSGRQVLPADPAGAPRPGAAVAHGTSDLTWPGKTAATLAVDASRTFFATAGIVVLSAADDASQLRAASLAMTLGVPALVDDGDPTESGMLATEMTRLSTHTVLVVGDAEVPEMSPDRPMLRAVTAPNDLAGLQVVTGHELSGVEVVDPGEEATTIADAREPFEQLFTLASQGDAPAPDESDGELATLPGLPPHVTTTRSSQAVVLSDGAPDQVPALGTARAAGARVLLLPPSGSVLDLEVSGAVERVITSGEVGDLATVGYQVRLLAAGVELPGDGLELLDGTTYLALRGLPGVPELGPLGGSDAAGAVARLVDLVSGIDIDAVPTAEVVATVATSDAGPSGQYSARQDLATIKELVQAAEAADVMVLLAFQPGRATFVQQLQEYSEALTSPNVGVVLEPRWRLDAHEVPGGHSGTLGQQELGRAIDWLADFTRTQGLPPKLIVVRDPISPVTSARPEVAVVLEVDGAAVTAEVPTPDGADPQQVPPIPAVTAQQVWAAAVSDAAPWWGWREGSVPVPVGELLDLDPAPVYILFGTEPGDAPAGT